MTGLLQDHLTLTPTATGSYERHCDRTWWGHEALFGGYVQSLMLAAMSDTLSQPDMPAQSMHMQFLRPFLDGPVRIEVATERIGRTMANMSARGYSRGKLAGLALATFAIRRRTAEFIEQRPPDEFSALTSDERPSDATFVPSHDHYDFYPRIGGFIRGQGGEARVGGWIRQRSPGPIDHAFILVVADNWMPAAYRRWTAGVPAVTADITTHFRCGFPRSDLDPSSPIFVELRSTASLGGFVDEDVIVWSSSGEFLAQSRQVRYVLG